MQGNKAQIIQVPIFLWVFWWFRIQCASGLDSNPTSRSDLNSLICSKGLHQKMAKADPLPPSLLLYIFWSQIRWKSTPEEFRGVFWVQPLPVSPRMIHPWHTPRGGGSLNAKGWAFIDVPAPQGPFLTLTDPKGSGWSSISSIFWSPL